MPLWKHHRIVKTISFAPAQCFILFARFFSFPILLYYRARGYDMARQGQKLGHGISPRFANKRMEIQRREIDIFQYIARGLYIDSCANSMQTFDKKNLIYIYFGERRVYTPIKVTECRSEKDHFRFSLKKKSLGQRRR